MRHSICGSVAVCVASSLAAPAKGQQDPPTLPAVEVIAPTPVPGLDVPRDRLPTNVHTLRNRELREEEAANFPDVLGLRLPGVTVNEIQGNPYQPDINFRGFTASPLLGTPQGLSVYQDGVRVNEPFGDTVNWDLIPQMAVDNVTLVPGSNPLFGLNTLGGALAIHTKSGDTHPGGAIEFSGGSFKRFVGQFEVGQRLGADMHGYAAGTWFNEDGWRDYSPSDVKQLFAKLGQRTQRFDWDLSITVADTDLIGNGLVPQSFLDQRRESIFTHPDQTRHQLTMPVFSASYFLTDSSRLSGTLYYRGVRTRTLNGDTNDDFEDGTNDLAAGGTGLNIGTAVDNRTATDLDGYGGALQWSVNTGNHQVALGATADFSTAKFQQSAQLGVFDPTRLVLETDPEELENALEGRTRAGSLFATDTWSLRPDLHLTLSGRFNVTKVKLQDTGPSAPALDGEHSFSKFNPAAGIAYEATSALTLFGGFNQGNRAPTPIELGCADPNRPCTLPNSLAADPPLNQVVAQTFELGARGRVAGNVRWNAGVFQTTNTNDILFVGTTTSAGYFTNFGKTRRRGVELGVSGSNGPLRWNAGYSFVRATFESSACLVSENNSSRGTSPSCSPEDPANPGTFLGDDLIEVSPGNRIPGIPEHTFKLTLIYQPAAAWQIGADFVAFSDQFVRGNENNDHQAGTFEDLNGDDRTFAGSGKAAGYMIVNLYGRYAFARDWELFGRINNLFDTRYATAGALAENPFDAAGAFQTDSDAWTRETFYAPGAPLSAWIGIRYKFGRKGPS
jgi:outer membrane receptor protein involved in Fe transport